MAWVSVPAGIFIWLFSMVMMYRTRDEFDQTSGKAEGVVTKTEVRYYGKSRGTIVWVRLSDSRVVNEIRVGRPYSYTPEVGSTLRFQTPPNQPRVLIPEGSSGGSMIWMFGLPIGIIVAASGFMPDSTAKHLYGRPENSSQHNPYTRH